MNVLVDVAVCLTVMNSTCTPHLHPEVERRTSGFPPPRLTLTQNKQIHMRVQGNLFSSVGMQRSFLKVQLRGKRRRLRCLRIQAPLPNVTTRALGLDVKVSEYAAIWNNMMFHELESFLLTEMFSFGDLCLFFKFNQTLSIFCFSVCRPKNLQYIQINKSRIKNN